MSTQRMNDWFRIMDGTVRRKKNTLNYRNRRLLCELQTLCSHWTWMCNFGKLHWLSSTFLLLLFFFSVLFFQSLIWRSTNLIELQLKRLYSFTFSSSLLVWEIAECTSVYAFHLTFKNAPKTEWVFRDSFVANSIQRHLAKKILTCLEMGYG